MDSPHLSENVQPTPDAETLAMAVTQKYSIPVPLRLFHC